MPARINDVIRHLRQVVLRQHEARLTDGELLGRVIEGRDEDAFAALMRRHGPMVWGVCRRLLRHHHDAEDAFQATFLVLARKAASVRPRAMVGNWLYGVAHQTARKARAILAKRRARERQVNDLPDCETTHESTSCDLRFLIDQELSRLPDKYRAAIVLCDLESMTRKQAARQLGLPEGTLAGRLTRARAILARRLLRHGLGLSTGVLVTVSYGDAAATVSPLLFASTLKAATWVAAGPVAAAGAVSAQVAALTEGVMKAMFLTKVKTAAACFLFVCVLGAGLGTSTLAGQDQPGVAQASPERRVGEAPPAPASDDAPRTDDKVKVLERRLRQLERENQLLRGEVEALRKDPKAVIPPLPMKIEQRVPPLPMKIEVRIFSLRHIPANEGAKVLTELFSLGGQRIVAFPTTNSIVVKGTSGEINAIDEMIQRLEEHAARHHEALKRRFAAEPPKK